MSAPEDVEAVLAHQLGWETEGAVCRAPGCDWSVPMQVMYPDDQHRAHVAAILTAYVVEKQREAVEAAAAERVTWPRTANSFAASQRVYAATTYPTPKEAD